MRIGIDVGGSHVGVGIIDGKSHTIISKEEMDYTSRENNMEDVVMDTIIKLINTILEKNNKKIENIEQIGIAFPGTVADGVVVKAENLGIKNFQIVKKIKNRFNTNIYLENDAKCAAIAEKEFGCLKTYDDALFLIIGTGVGGAAFLNGKMLRPKRFSGFEVGHMVINKNGEKCGCGRNGCFEAYGSMKRFKEKIQKEFNLNSIDGKFIEQFMKDNESNEKLQEMINQYTSDLAIGIANLINIVEPEAIAIGGSFGHYKEILLPKLINYIAEGKELYNKEDIPKIMVAELKNDAGIIGAAMI